MSVLFRALLNNKWLKVVALVLALITWHGIKDNLLSESVASGVARIMDVDVQALQSAGRGMRVEVEPKSVKVTVHGHAETMERLTVNNLRAYVDCIGLEPAAQYHLPVQIHKPAGVQVGKIEPGTVTVTVKKR